MLGFDMAGDRGYVQRAEGLHGWILRLVQAGYRPVPDLIFADNPPVSGTSDVADEHDPCHRRYAFGERSAENRPAIRAVYECACQYDECDEYVEYGSKSCKDGC